ncbi:MAG: alpha/beta fold hydrolase [Chloroflexi bacterium]|nr:alpha/beta fold hydrolase [Chloroflexota bacterium]OJV95868.1 MAG: hypothetical protein BGO39_21405 [Chloroflexi bacterium 54-19]
MLKSKKIYPGLALLIMLAVLLQACGNDTILTLPSPTPGSATSQTPSTTAVQTTNPATAAPPSTTDSAVSTTVPPQTTVAVTTASAATTAVATTAPATTAALNEGSPTAASSGTGVPRFEAATKCPFNLPAGQTLNQTVRCGYVIVPETHAQPNNGKTLKIAVLVFKSKATNPAEPVIYLEGGPGGHIQSIIDLMTGDFYNGFTQRGDAIFFDQRGVGNSQPELYCPEIETQSEQDAPVILNPTDDAQHSVDSALACHDRLAKQGVNLAAFNSVESAGDVNDIRQALGYDKINVYGASYGTILAQTVMRLYPQIVRSTVIDSVVPPNVNPDITAIASGSRTMNLIFQTCAADAACNRAYPNLKDLFTKTYNLLNTTQPTVKVTIPETNTTLNVKVDGSKFVSVLFQLLYDKQTIQLLPRIISLVNSGNNAILAPLMAVPFEVNLETDLGMYFSVECAEEWPFSKLSDNQAAESQALPEFAQDSDIGVQSSITLCQKWNVPAASQAQVTLLKSDIPTLVMEGQFDPITPPEFGQKVAQGLSKSFYVEFPYNGHGEVVPDNVCGINVMKAFLDNPSSKPDSSCTSSLTIKFS